MGPKIQRERGWQVQSTLIGQTEDTKCEVMRRFKHVYAIEYGDYSYILFYFSKTPLFLPSQHCFSICEAGKIGESPAWFCSPVLQPNLSNSLRLSRPKTIPFKFPIDAFFIHWFLWVTSRTKLFTPSRFDFRNAVVAKPVSKTTRITFPIFQNTSPGESVPVGL